VRGTAKIRIGIYGYGNVGKSVEKAVARNDDMSLEAVFTRRDPNSVTPTTGVKVVPSDEILTYKDKIDVMVLCGGSATDLPEQGPEMAKHFNTVDSYDTHAKIPEYLKKMDKNARMNGRTAVISVGWDPGVLSMMRSLFISSVPDGGNNTFWGPGVSQGHSDAIRRVEGVADGIQYTVPSESVLNEVRDGSRSEYTMAQKHRRVCYVVPKEGANRDTIAGGIRNMPNYFVGYDTEINFITAEQMHREHSKMPHEGYVFRNGTTGTDERNHMGMHIKFDSNPGFTASVMVAYARAAFRLFGEGDHGAKTVFDIPVSYLSKEGRDRLIAELL